jgi:hypothetical protein
MQAIHTPNPLLSLPLLCALLLLYLLLLLLLLLLCLSAASAASFCISAGFRAGWKPLDSRLLSTAAGDAPAVTFFAIHLLQVGGRVSGRTLRPDMAAVSLESAAMAAAQRASRAVLPKPCMFVQYNTHAAFMK